MPAKKAPAKKTTKLLSWNAYVKKHAGKGLTMSEHSKNYKNYRKSRSASPATRSASAKRSASLRRSPSPMVSRITIRAPSRGYYDMNYNDDYMYDTETDEEEDDDFYSSMFAPKRMAAKPLRQGLHGDAQFYQNVPRQMTLSNLRALKPAFPLPTTQLSASKAQQVKAQLPPPVPLRMKLQSPDVVKAPRATSPSFLAKMKQRGLVKQQQSKYKNLSPQQRARAEQMDKKFSQPLSYKSGF
jgi:hypothetical protein